MMTATTTTTTTTTTTKCGDKATLRLTIEQHTKVFDATLNGCGAVLLNPSWNV